MGKPIDTSSSDTVRRIRKVGRYHLALFLLPVFSLLFYGWLRAPHLNERPDNPQRTAPAHLRGRILDREGQPLAHTEDERRVYPQGESVGSLVGYQLRGRNQTGLEAALQERLSPPLPPASLQSAIQQDRQIGTNRRSRLQGPDVSVTIDSQIQARLYDALRPASGAVVVADRQGRILAAVSSPSFDPNKVRERWQDLRSDPRSPFIERVGSGLYPVTMPDGMPLAEIEGVEHGWLSETPFPSYPNASSATVMEGRLFVTPLMLLELSYWLSGTEPTSALRLIVTESSPQDVVDGNKPIQVELDTRIEGETLITWELGAPAFYESPPFLAVLGRSGDGIFFSLVLESRGQISQDAQRRVLDLLSREVWD